MKQQKPSNSLKNWAEDDRPREKLLSKGRDALSDAELLAILIGSGNRKETAVDLAKRIMSSANNDWNKIARWTTAQFCEFNGIGDAKAIRIVAGLEIGRRKAKQTVPQKIKVSSSQQVFEVLHPILSDLSAEEFWVLYLNQANIIIHKEQISKGGITQTVVDQRIIMKIALQQNATSIILSHNHPSGNTSPSQADIQLTKKIKQAGDIMNIKLLDHLIITQQSFFSFADQGMI